MLETELLDVLIKPVIETLWEGDIEEGDRRPKTWPWRPCVTGAAEDPSREELQEQVDRVIQCPGSRERDTCITKEGVGQDDLQLCDGEGKDRLAGGSQGDRQEREGGCALGPGGYALGPRVMPKRKRHYYLQDCERMTTFCCHI